MIPTILQPFFNKIYDGNPAAVFSNTTEHAKFVNLLEANGVSFITKIIKGKRAGVTRRSFVIMAIKPTESTSGIRD